MRWYILACTQNEVKLDNPRLFLMATIIFRVNNGSSVMEAASLPVSSPTAGHTSAPTLAAYGNFECTRWWG